MGLYEKFKELVFGKKLTAQTGTHKDPPLTAKTGTLPDSVKTQKDPKSPVKQPVAQKFLLIRRL